MAAALVIVRQAERQLFIRLVGSKRPCSHAGKTKCSGSTLLNNCARTRSSRNAEKAISLIGIVLCPASLLLLRTVMIRARRSASRHRRFLISQARIVVLKARMAAKRAFCHSGRFFAVASSLIFSE